MLRENQDMRKTQRNELRNSAGEEQQQQLRQGQENARTGSENQNRGANGRNN
jgi:hypothetical protein